MVAVSENSNRNCGAFMEVGWAGRIASNLISRLLLVSDPISIFLCQFLVNVRGVIVCYFTGLNLADCCVSVCYFTGFNLAERGVIVCSFTLTEILELGVNECSFSRLLVQADLGVHELSFS